MNKLILSVASLVLFVTASNAQVGAPRSTTTVSNNNFGTRLSTNYGRNFSVGQPNTALGQTPGLAIRPTTPALQPGTPALQPGTTAINPAGETPAIPPSPVVPSGTGTASTPGAALGNQDTTAIGQPGVSIGQPATALGQPGSTAIGQQNSTAIGQQTPSQPNAIIVNADGSITRVPAAGGTVGAGLGGTNFGFGTNGVITPTNRFNHP